MDKMVCKAGRGTFGLYVGDERMATINTNLFEQEGFGHHVCRAVNRYDRMKAALEKIKGGHSNDPQMDAINALKDA